MKDKSQRKHELTTEQVTEYSRHVPGKNASHTVRHGCASLLCFGRARSFIAIPFKNVIALIDVKMRHETVKKYSRTNEKEEEAMTLLLGVEFERETYRFVFQISTRTDASLIW
jgi:hypothetical protein